MTKRLPLALSAVFAFISLMTAAADGMPQGEPKAGAKAEPVSARLIRSLVHPVRTATAATIRFSPDSARLYASCGSSSRMLVFWDVATGKELSRIEIPPGGPVSLETADLSADWSALYVPRENRSSTFYDKDGLKAAWINFDGEVLVFDVATGQPRPSLKPPPGHGVITTFASPDGRKVVAVEELAYEVFQAAEGPPKGRTVLWDTRMGTAKPLGDGSGHAAFTPDSRQFVLSLSQGNPPSDRLKLFDADGNELRELAAAERQRIAWPTISPDGKRLAFVQGINTMNQPAVLRVLDLQTGKEQAVFPSGGNFWFFAIAFSADSQRLAAADYNGGVRVWDVATGRPVLEKSFGGDTQLGKVAFLPDGRLAVLARPKQNTKAPGPDLRDLPQPRVVLFDLATPVAEPEVAICPPGHMGGLAVSPGGKTLAVGGTGAVHLFDLARKK